MALPSRPPAAAPMAAPAIRLPVAAAAEDGAERAAGHRARDRAGILVRRIGIIGAARDRDGGDKDARRSVCVERMDRPIPSVRRPPGSSRR